MMNYELTPQQIIETITSLSPSQLQQFKGMTKIQKWNFLCHQVHVVKGSEAQIRQCYDYGSQTAYIDRSYHVGNVEDRFNTFTPSGTRM
jgi:hypothetical protein